MPSVLSPSTGSRAQALQLLSEIPPFSPVLNRLLATLANEDISIMTVADIIEKDAVVAGNILKLVNSALYSRRNPVTSMRSAASLLGINRLRNTVLGMSITRMWNQARVPPTWSAARFNLHSVAVALLSDLLAQRLSVDFAEGAFLAGLFHDIGRLLIAVSLRQDYERIAVLSRDSGRSWADCELEILGFTHSDLSADVVAAWKLPAPIRAAVEHHHVTLSLQANPSRVTFSLATLVHIADTYANLKGISIEKDLPGNPDLPNPLEVVGIREPAALIKEFESEYESLTLFFR